MESNERLKGLQETGSLKELQGRKGQALYSSRFESTVLIFTWMSSRLPILSQKSSYKGPHNKAFPSESPSRVPFNIDCPSVTIGQYSMTYITATFHKNNAHIFTFHSSSILSFIFDYMLIFYASFSDDYIHI